MPLRFGAYLAAAIKARKLSNRQFALLVGCPPQNPHEIIKGQRKLPAKNIDRWSIALGELVDRKLFRTLCLLEDCPEEIRGEFLRLAKLR